MIVSRESEYSNRDSSEQFIAIANSTEEAALAIPLPPQSDKISYQNSLLRQEETELKKLALKANTRIGQLGLMGAAVTIESGKQFTQYRLYANPLFYLRPHADPSVGIYCGIRLYQYQSEATPGVASTAQTFHQLFHTILDRVLEEHEDPARQAIRVVPLYSTESLKFLTSEIQ